ncbi:seven-hairpin glycosidase [Fomitiporia mediterranea MF3/22]|uniref:seven-hairpin glycosidase n=1 Tax=Fomitiporia mediterranea (strain MF3/22) TaxID=694068 RepID=UPI000440817D|nr:seven-hairpin glycosidase [Fomitiporia mediterranea MF3/22]EJC99387.1 seven-hairpin glycosidase [Fomitiporia mediterranea MF3/22]
MSVHMTDAYIRTAFDLDWLQSSCVLSRTSVPRPASSSVALTSDHSFILSTRFLTTQPFLYNILLSFSNYPASPMFSKRTLLAALALTGASQAIQVQKPGLRLPPNAAENANLIKSMFSEAYETYRKFAFGHDDLQPVSLTFNDGRNGWGATIVDGMATMFIMGLDDFFNEAVNFSAQIDFSRSQVEETVSLFETTIRYVGGLLSSFELSGNKHTVLVEKAKEVADKMAFAWVGDNDLPFGEMNFTTNQPVVAATNIAEAGTLTLEWALLSKLTGNGTYRNLAEKSVRHIISLDDPLPGLAAQCIDPSSGQFDCGYVTWGGGSDSYFEYLIKYPLLIGTADPTFVDEWRLAVDSSIKYLLSTSTVGNHTNLADFDDNRQIRHIGSHLACFHGGNWLLGGKLLNNDTIVDIALELVETCWNTYQSTATGIGPETFAWMSEDGNFTGGNPPSASDLKFYDEHGFYVLNGGSDYILRPEVLESNFYAWRVTGDVKYFERARAAADSMNKFLKVNNAFAGIEDVTVTNSAFIDDTESFFFAEVMKYLFLTFDDPEHISLDNFVFNTEAQPFKIDSGLLSFGGNAINIPSTTAFKPSSTASAFPAVSPNSKLPTPVVPLIHSGGTPAAAVAVDVDVGV